MNHPAASPKILVAPLDWGLGHATRCIPIIRALKAQHCQVVVAGPERVKALLQQEFPGLPFLDLPGYNIEYASSAWGLAVKMAAQIPRLLSVIKEENAWLEKVAEEEHLDAVISDNRYGLYTKKATSVFVTHQLLIKAPVKMAEELLQELNYQYINRFDECWVPDADGENNLAGDLSHPALKPTIPLHYLGALSRFSNYDVLTQGDYLLVILSGPEPQRTLLEKIILKDLEEYTRPVVLVRGLPLDDGRLEVPENVTVHNHLPAKELEQKMKGASLVIGRCGYSTVMDLAAMKKKSILIPTPGQTEQEYLARHLMQRNFAFCVEQKKFKLKAVLALAEAFNYRFPNINDHAVLQVVQFFVGSLKARKAATADGR